MIERKAIFVSQDKLTNLHNENIILVIFDLEANRVVGVETIAFKKDGYAHRNIFALFT